MSYRVIAPAFLLLLAGAVVLAGSAAGQESKLRRSSYFAVIAAELRKLGFSCLGLNEIYFVGELEGQSHFRAVCGRMGGLDLAEYRIIAGGSGIQRAEPWSSAPGSTLQPRLSQETEPDSLRNRKAPALSASGEE